MSHRSSRIESRVGIVRTLDFDVVVTRRDLESILLLDRESRSFEVKGPGDITDKGFVARVARAVMAMGNLRDGGQVCIGIADNKIAEMRPGLSAEQVDQWMNNDDVNDKLASYSDPPVAFQLQCFDLTSGARVVVIDVEEFEIDLHICKKDYEGVLQRGQTYVRPRGKPQSSPVPTLTDMRDLHRIAIDKGVREYVRRTQFAAGPFASAGLPSPRQEDTAAFDAETGVAWADTSPIDGLITGVVHDRVAEPAFTDVSVRLGPYEAGRIPETELFHFAAQHAVRLRGWPVPMVSDQDRTVAGERWIGQDLQSDLVPHAEAWRLFTSGQFLQRRVLVTDLRDGEELRAADPHASGAVAVWDILLYLVELAELGARYATALGVETVTFDVELKGAVGRELVSGDRRRDLHGSFRGPSGPIRAAVTINSENLIASPRPIGVELAQQVFRGFGLKADKDILMRWQEEVFD